MSFSDIDEYMYAIHHLPPRGVADQYNENAYHSTDLGFSSGYMPDIG